MASTSARRSRGWLRTELTGLLFSSPAIIGLAAVMAYPVAASLYYSFCNYSVLKPPTWVGTANYERLLTDELFWTSLWNTLYFAAFSVPLGIIVAFLLALLLNVKVRGMTVYRTIFYIPSIVPMVASSVLWIWLFNPQYGAVNALLRHVPGISDPPGWLSDPAWAKPTIILWSIWGVGNTVVIFLAGLQGVPQALYEAAEVDGASPWQRTLSITVPYMTPYLFFALVMGLIGSFQFFTPAMVMTNGTGGPADSTMFYALNLFHRAFSDFKMGYACAMAWVLFILVVIATLVVVKSSARYVYYESADEGAV
ncbi:MAG: carbohydrate ABC transporter permease [Armatimonadota bacterium]|nr:sugar ABC transporter permease [Acidobacteriota bacterium]